MVLKVKPFVELSEADAIAADRKAFRPFYLALKVAGVIPNWYEPSSRRYKIYCIVLVVIAWLNAVRSTSHFATTDSANYSTFQYIYWIGLCLYNFTAAAFRTNVTLSCFSRKLNAPFFLHLFKRESFKLTNSELQTILNSRRLYFVSMLTFAVFSYAGNAVVIGILLIENKSAFGMLAAPLSYFISDSTIWNLTSIPFWLSFSIISDLGIILGLALANMIVVIVARKFATLADKTAQYENAEPNLQMIMELRQEYGCLMETVKSLDSTLRLAIFVTVGYGFYGFLVNLYQATLTGLTDSLIKGLELLWIFFSFGCLTAFMFPSAYLDHCAEKVRESLFKMRIASQDPAIAIQLNLLIGQMSTERATLTFLGIVSLNRETIAALIAGLLTYFLILIDYISGEKSRAQAASNLNDIDLTTTTILATTTPN